MRIAERLSLGSMFSGVGGLDLGLCRGMDLEPAWFCEQDVFCRGVLSAWRPGVPVHQDVRALRGSDLGHVDVLCGGFPCQDVSNAGRQAGLEGARSGLWFEMLRVVSEVHPAWVVIENVAALVLRGLPQVLAGLAEAGYAAEWQVLTALSAGALHVRRRVFIVAYPDLAGAPVVFRDPAVVARAFLVNRGGMWQEEPADVARTVTRDQVAPRDRRARLRALGNAVVPQVAEVVGRCVAEAISASDPTLAGWRFAAVGVPGSLPPCGAHRRGLTFVTRPLCDQAAARAMHARTPGPFHDLMPTPTASDASGAGSRNTVTSSAKPGVSLTDAVRGDGGQGRISRNSRPLRESVAGHLNPEWVTWLMGFPPGWLEVP